MASNVDTVRALFEESWTWRDHSNLDSRVASQIRFHANGREIAFQRGQLVEVIDRWHEALDGFRFEVDQVLASEDMAMAWLTLRGTHVGELMGQRPSGNDIAVEHAFMFRLEGGVIAEVWEVFDRATFHEQLADDARAPQR